MSDINYVLGTPYSPGFAVYDLGVSSGNDTALITAGMTALNAIGGGILLGRPHTTYTGIDIPWGGSNIILAGYGPSTIFKMSAGTADNHNLFTAIGSTLDTSGNLIGIGIRDCTLLGTVATDGFVQHRHLLAMGGVSDVSIENVRFQGFQGDAIYLGHPSGTERHNQRIRIRNNTFDGVNQDNRNSISLIDAEDIGIVNNSFVNCTRANMPGAIDIEPNNTYTWAVLRDIRIIGNGFKNVRGNGGVICLSLQLSQTSLTTPMTGLIISNNTFVDCASAAHAIYLSQIQTPVLATRRNDILVEGNAGYNLTMAWEVDGITGARFQGNTWENTSSDGAAIGFTNICIDIASNGDTFNAVNGSNCIAIYKTLNFTMTDCDFLNSATNTLRFGTGSGATGTSDNVDIMNCRIKGIVASAILLKDAAHTVVNTADNRAFLNRWNGLSTVPLAGVFGVTGNNL